MGTWVDPDGKNGDPVKKKRLPYWFEAASLAERNCKCFLLALPAATTAASATLAGLVGAIALGAVLLSATCT